MITPNNWQIEALDKFVEHELKSFLLEATPGGGKTIFSGLCARHLFENDICDFALIVVPSTLIKGDGEAGFLGDWHKLDIEITTVLRDGQGCPREFRGAVITYQQLPNIISTIETWAANGKRIFAVADEVHHAIPENVWGASIERLERCAIKILAMTGTPFRGDQRRISFVLYDTDGRAVPDHRYTYRRAVADSVCRKVDFITDDGLADFVWQGEDPSQVRISEAEDDRDLSSVSRTIFRGDSEWLKRAIERVDACLDEYREWDADAAGLIVCMPASDDWAEKYVNQVAGLIRKTTGEDPLVVTHDDANSNALIEKFRGGTDRYICAVRKVSEGVDIKRIRVVLLATRPTTELLFRQIVGRAVRVDDRRRPGDATIFIPKFQQLQTWARTIAEEAQAGLKDRDTQARTASERNESNSFFTALGSKHEEGGGISDFGDEYSAAEINAAERDKASDPQLFGIPITTLAHIRRKLGIEPDPAQTAQEPLQVQKKQLRQQINRAARQLAIRRNASEPDYKAIWIELHRHTGAKSIDDLTDNFSIEIMRQALSLLHRWLGRSDAAA